MAEISKNNLLKRSIESDITLQKYRGTCPNIFYGLEAYGSH